MDAKRPIEAVRLTKVTQNSLQARDDDSLSTHIKPHHIRRNMKGKKKRNTKAEERPTLGSF
jgi:hypothetical protein